MDSSANLPQLHVGLRPDAPTTGHERAFLLSFASALGIALLVVLALLIRLVAVGELYDDPARADGARLRGTVYFDYPDFKLTETLRRSPEILVLGSSTVMEWRQILFPGCVNRRDCFYNAGGAMVTTRDALEFFRRLPPDHPPKVLLIGVNTWHLDLSADNPDRNKHGHANFTDDPRAKIDFSLKVTRDLALLAVTDGRVRSALLNAAPADVRGLAALAHAAGFRPDGSYDYGPDELARVAPLTPLQRSEEVLGRIQKGCCRFDYFEHPDQQSITELIELLDLAAERGTKVIAFTPPFEQPVLDAVYSEPRLARGTREVIAALQSLFGARHVPYLPLDSLEDVGCDPHEAWDGIHPTEVCDARQLLRLLTQTSAADPLRPYTTVGAVRTLIEGRSSPYSLEGR